MSKEKPTIEELTAALNVDLEALNQAIAAFIEAAAEFTRVVEEMGILEIVKSRS